MSSVAEAIERQRVGRRANRSNVPRGVTVKTMPCVAFKTIEIRKSASAVNRSTRTGNLAAIQVLGTHRCNR